MGIFCFNKKQSKQANERTNARESTTNVRTNHQANDRPNELKEKKKIELSNPFTSHLRFDCKNITTDTGTEWKKDNINEAHE